MCGIYGDVVGLKGGEIGMEDELLGVGGKSMVGMKVVKGLRVMVEIEVGV